MLESTIFLYIACKPLKYIFNILGSYIIVVSIVKIPPTNVFVECCTVRVMGPKGKDREVMDPPKSDGGSGTVVSTGNFGYDTRGNTSHSSYLLEGNKGAQGLTGCEKGWGLELMQDLPSTLVAFNLHVDACIC